MAKTLLLADDSVVIQKLVGLSFANEDVELIYVDNGDDAITRARETKPDLVLADVVMPGKNGYEVCQALKRDPELARIPVLLLTGTFEAFDEERARQAGSDGHITKPFEAQVLVRRVKEVMDSTPAPSAAAAPAPAEPSPIGVPAASSANDAFDFLDGDANLAPDDAETPSDAFAFGAPTPGASNSPAATVPDVPDDFGALGGDRTIALVPEQDATPAKPAFSDPLAAVAPPPDMPPGDPGATILTDDFLSGGSGNADPGATVLDDSFGGQQTSPLAAALDAPEPASSQEIGFGEELSAPPVTDPNATVLADDLFGSEIPAVSPDLSHPGGAAPPLLATPPAFGEEDDSSLEDAEFGFEAPPTPALEIEPLATRQPREPAPGGGSADFDVSASDLRETFPAADEDEDLPAAKSSTAPQTGAGVPDISPVLRDRIHETLEKVAWEAFSGLPESIVRLVLERVESIAWEVVPQMAEALIKEELRRMKGEPEG